MSKSYLTQEQFDDFKQKLDHLMNVEVVKNADDIARATAQGDLSENAEYESAKDDQLRIHQEIKRIENILADVEIIQRRDDVSFAEVGHKITIKMVDDPYLQETITLMSYGNGKETITVDAPLGKAVLGKSVGDRVIVEAPIGDLMYEIMKIE